MNGLAGLDEVRRPLALRSRFAWGALASVFLALLALAAAVAVGRLPYGRAFSSVCVTAAIFFATNVVLSVSALLWLSWVVRRDEQAHVVRSGLNLLDVAGHPIIDLLRGSNVWYWGPEGVVTIGRQFHDWRALRRVEVHRGFANTLLNVIWRFRPARATLGFTSGTAYAVMDKSNFASARNQRSDAFEAVIAQGTAGLTPRTEESRSMSTTRSLTVWDIPPRA
jgi:hypothetical protein